MQTQTLLIFIIIFVVYTILMWATFKKRHKLTLFEFYKYMFNIFIGILIGLITWPIRIIMNKCGHKTDIGSWLDNHFPLLPSDKY